MTDAAPASEPVRVFCYELRHLTRRSSLPAAAAARRLHMSRSQYYAIINGDVRRPPDWSKIETIVRACGEGDESVAAWRHRHDTMLKEYEAVRGRPRDIPAQRAPEPDAAPDADVVERSETDTGPAPVAAGPDADHAAEATRAAESAGHRRGGRRLVAAGAVAVLALGAAAVVGWQTGRSQTPTPDSLGDPEPPRPSAAASVVAGSTLGPPRYDLPGELSNKADPGEYRACDAATPAAGTELMTLEHGTLPNNNKINNPWWGSNGSVHFNALEKTAFDVNITDGLPSEADTIILHSCVPLIEGHRYIMRFRAAANPASSVRLRIQDNRYGNWIHSRDQVLQLKPGFTAIDVTFPAARTSKASEITFQVGGHADFRLALVDISLKEIPAP